MTAPVDTTAATPIRPSTDVEVLAPVLAGALAALDALAVHIGHGHVRKQLQGLKDQLHGIQPAAPRPAPRLPTCDEDAARAELLIPSVTPERRAELEALLVGAPDPAATANAAQRAVLDEG